MAGPARLARLWSAAVPRRAGLLVLGVVLARVALGQDAVASGVSPYAGMSLEELLDVEVVTASKHQQTLAEAPATITVIRREQIEQNAWRDVADALATVPGLFVSSGRDYQVLGVRGVSLPLDVNSRVLVLLDGHTMNNAWSSSGHLDELLSLPIEAVERIEVIRGPSSSIYGSNAFLAVVNILSRPASVASSGQPTATRLGWDSLGRYRAAQSAGWRSRHGVELGLHVLAKAGPGPELQFADMTRPGRSAPAPTPADGRTAGTDFERGYALGLHAAWQGAALRAYFADRLRGLPSARDDAIFGDPYNSVGDSRGFLEARYQLTLGDHSLVARAGYDRTRHRQYLHRDPTDWAADRWYSANPHTVSEGNDDAVGGELQATLRLFEVDTLVLGFEVQHHTVSQPTYELDLVAGAPIADSLRGGLREADGRIVPVDYWSGGAYLQNTLRLLDHLQLVLGLRHDAHSLFTRADSAQDLLAGFSPRLAAVYVPVPELSLKVLYGEAFRYPSLFEARFDDGVSVCGNAELRPERVRTLELSTAWAAGLGLEVNGALYASQASDLIERTPVASCYQDSGPRQRYTNQASILQVGAETGLHARLPAGVELAGQLGVHWTSRAVGDASTPLANAPPVVAGASATLPLWKDRLGAVLRARYVAARLNWTLDRARPEAPYLLVDAGLVARRLLAGLAGSLLVSNALDTAYRDPVTSRETIPTAIPQDGIALHLRLGYDW